MSWNADLRTASPLRAVATLLSHLGLRRNIAGISISRWPRGRQRRAYYFALGLGAATAVVGTVSYRMLNAKTPVNEELREAYAVCAARPTCMEWRVLAKCPVSSVIGRTRIRTRVFDAYARTSQEAAWMIANFERYCVIESVELSGQIAPERRAQLRQL